MRHGRLHEINFIPIFYHSIITKYNSKVLVIPNTARPSFNTKLRSYTGYTVSPVDVKIEYIRSYLPGDGTNGEISDSYTIVKKCQGDFAPSDGDVDGLDLVWQIFHPGDLNLSDFAAEFARTDCPAS